MNKTLSRLLGFVLLILFFLSLVFIGYMFYGLLIDGDRMMKERNQEIWDNGWHAGYNSCQNNSNLTTEEMWYLNSYRIKKLENKTATEKVYLYYNIDDPTKIYVYENETFVETYINNSSEIK